jgi:penicillin-binding protein 1A
MGEFKVPKRIKKAKNTKKTSQFVNFLIFFCSVSLALITGFYVYLMSLPPIKNLGEFKPNIVTKFYSHDGEVIKTFTAFTFSKVALKDVPDNLKNALISTEDKNFYKHNGFDIFGLMRSTLANIVAGRVVQGASTISQQLARILFLNNEKTFTRKIKELMVAVQIEKTISKDQILEMYLNNVYLGSGAYGVEGAAQIYFNKHVKNLTLAESALIAGLPQAPSVYSPFHSKKLALKRRNKVLRRMLTMKYITKDEYNKALKEPLKLNPLPQIYTLNKAPYFCDYVMKELEKLGFDETEVSQGGYKIVTTLDYKTQQVANKAVPNIMKSWGLVGDKRQAALLSINPHDGRILAYVGGKDYSKSQYDRVTQAVRPPGSAFKPIVYAVAVEKGVNPNDPIDDTPFKAGSWSPKNYGNKYRGTIPVYKALMVSSNVCAARLIELTGVRAVIQMARVMGISTPLEYDYTIALGSNGVKLFEFVRAYGAFANAGYRVDLYAIERIESSRGKILYQAPEVRSTKVMDANTAAIMTAMMKTVIKSGTGIAANIGKPAAGKTGTTDDSRDAYFVGYTPDVVTGVWVGNDDNTKNGRITGGTVPALIWKEVMKTATESSGNKDFDYPPIDLNNYVPEKPVEVSEQVVNNIDEAVEDVRKQSVEEITKNYEDESIDIPLAIPSGVSN